MRGRTLKRAACVLLPAALIGCSAIRPARMALPARLDATAERVSLTGLGAGPRGEFSVAGHGGAFTRRATRLSFFDAVATDRANTTFTLNGPAFAAPVSARCGLAQRTATLNVMAFTPRPLQYDCAFEGVAGARLVLQEGAKGLAGKLGQAQRRGFVDVGGTRLALRSVHNVQGSPLPLDAPIGYVFEAEGAAVGAVELNGTTPEVLLPRAVAQRQAALLAAIALALVWDPANRVGP
jgi:hypothetical protein